VGEEEIAASQSHVLMEKLFIVSASLFQSFPQIFDFGYPHAILVARSCSTEEISNALEACRVSYMGGVRRYNKLNRPWSFCFGAINQFLSDLGELLNEDLLHLRMKMSLRFFNED